jgi:MFS family permease
VYLLLLQRQGLSYVQISLLLSVWAASALLLELPSGILADLWSRKAVIALGMLLKAGGFLVWAFRPDFTGFLLGFIAWGAQEALCSGAAEALLYNALQLEDRESSFEAVAGAGELASASAIGSAMIAGGFLFERHPRLTLLLCSFFVLLAGMCVLGVREKNRRARSDAGFRAPDLRELGRSIRQAVAAPGLAAFGLLGAAFMAAYGTMEEFDTLYGLHVGLPVRFAGLWGALRLAVVGVGAALAAWLRRRLSLSRPARLLAWMAGAGLALLAGTLYARAWAVPLYFAYYFLFASADVVYWGALQRRLPSSSRATLTSLVSFALRDRK